MRRKCEAVGLAALIGASAIGAASAESQMHQSPLLERGSQDSCAEVREGRVQRGGYPWRFSCPGRGEAPRQSDRRAR